MSQDNDDTKNSDNAINKLPDTETMNNVDTLKYLKKIRTDVVTKAVEFILSPQIRNLSIDKKIIFLRSKKLTDQEIELAVQTAIKRSQTQNVHPLLPQTVNYNSSSAIQTQLASSNLFKKFVNPVICVAFSMYFGYHIYQKYVQKWLFGTQKSSMDKRLEVVEMSVQRCLLLLEEKNNKTEVLNAQADRQKELDQIRTELKSIKSLLLNRSQFPPAPVVSSIPQWQLSKTIKSQTDQSNKVVVVNGADTSTAPLPNMFNRKNSSPFSVVGSHTTGNVYGDIIDKNCKLTNDSVLNETTVLPMDSVDKSIKSEVATVDDSIVISEDVNH